MKDTSGRSLPRPFATLEVRSHCSRTLRDFSQCRPQDAYAAGIIDGEGWIGISRFSKSAVPTFQPKVEVALAEKALAVILWLKAEYGGNVYKKPDPKRPENAPCYRWSIAGEQAATFLQKISPALLLKIDQAELIQKLMSVMGPMPTNRRRDWTPAMSEQAQAMFEEMKRLNRRGPMQEMTWMTDQRQLDGSLETFSGTFPRSGMLVSGKLYQQPTLERHTAASASGSSVSMNWPTARAEDGESAGRRHSRNTSDTLTAAVRDWPTATARDYKGARSAEAIAATGRNPMTNTLEDAIHAVERAGPPHPATGPHDQASSSTHGKAHVPSTENFLPLGSSTFSAFPTDTHN